MRPVFAAALALGLLPAAAVAQTLPCYAVVNAPEVTLRAGPSSQYPETGKLPHGTKLIVHEEAPGGWLAVHAPGSVSWVQNSFIDFNKDRPIPQTVMTHADVTLAPGKIGLPQPLAEVRLAKVPEGSILKIIGTPVKFDGKIWYPVEPILGDYRYVPKDAVQFDQPVNTAFVVRDTPPPASSPGAAGGPGSPASPAASGAGSASPQHPLWLQAEAAEKDGRYEEAEKLFFQLARVMNEPGGDHDVANLCYTRIHMIREKKRNGAPGSRPAANPAGSRSSLPPPATSTSTSPSRDSRERATLLPPLAGSRNRQSAEPTRPPLEPSDSPVWTGPGKLLRTPISLNGKPTFVLESSPGVPRLYVIAAPGVDLEPFWKRTVDLYGTIHSHPNTKTPYVLVTDVKPNP